MLESLHIEGYAIIDQLDVTFSTGLTVLSGETGAGKSILIGALSLVFGGKGESSAIRSGHDETRVTAIVRVTDSADALSWLADRGFEPEDGTVIIRRTLKSSGRGSIFLQSTPVTKVDLREFTSLLFDIHGQHEHQSLLRIDSHRELIDRFGGTSAAVDEFRKVFSELSEKRRELQGLADDEQRMLRERDILSFAVGEIESAALTPGEEEQLRQDVRLLSQGEQLFTSITEFHDRMAESSGGALAGVRRGLQEMRKIGELVEEFRPQIDRLENAFYEIEDIASSVRQFQETVDFSPARLEESEQRLAEIRRLEKKYGNSIGQILDYAADAKEKLSRMESLEEARSALIADIERLEKRVWKEAAGISERRKTAAASLEKEIGERLQYLGMQKACFSIQVTRLEREDGTPLCTQYGIDRLEFLIAPNQGEPVKPLREIASGGEMSRIMLAIKSVLADSDTIRTLVFDEIDAGIGGQVAVAVGEHLAGLARNKQILCITHLPTIAVRSDHQFVIEKRIVDGRAITALREVSGEDRVSEIARMLSGDSDADVSRSHALKLLTEAGTHSGFTS